MRNKLYREGGFALGKTLFGLVSFVLIGIGVCWGVYKVDSARYEKSMNFLNEVALAELNFKKENTEYTDDFTKLKLNIPDLQQHVYSGVYQKSWGTCHLRCYPRCVHGYCTGTCFSGNGICVIDLPMSTARVFYEVYWDGEENAYRDSCTTYPKSSWRGKALCWNVTTRQYFTELSPIKSLIERYTLDMGDKTVSGNFANYRWINFEHRLLGSEK